MNCAGRPPGSVPIAFWGGPDHAESLKESRVVRPGVQGARVVGARPPLGPLYFRFAPAVVAGFVRVAPFAFLRGAALGAR